MVCECCGDKGKIIDFVSGKWIACPKCKGAVGLAKAIKVEDIADINLSEYTYDVLKIPECYRRVVYTEASFNNQIHGYYEGDINNLINCINKIRGNLLVGLLPDYSIYIHTPNEVDIALWVYSVQRLAVSKGITTMPYISVKELAYISNKEEQKETFFNYVNAQLCILDLGAVNTWDTAGTLADILRLRANKGLATIVTGYWSYEVIEANDKYGVKYLMSKEKMSLGILNCLSLRRKGKKDIKPVIISPEVNQDSIDSIASILE